MSISLTNLRKALAARANQPGIVERLGVRYYRYLARQSGTAGLRNLRIEELPDDSTLQTLAGNMTLFAVIIAFAAGALATAATVWVQVTYQDTLGAARYYALYGGTLVATLLLELAVLYWLGLKTVHSLACLAGHYRTSDDFFLPVNDSVPNILSRAALELPDPVIRYLGIDPLRHLSRSKLLLVATLYKAKVVLSSMAVRYLLIRFGGKAGSRTAFAWVAIPITGLWDAFTLYKVARDARLRLFGLKLAEHLAVGVLTDDLLGRLSPTARECAIRALASMMVLAQNYHPNLLILLLRLGQALEVKEGTVYDDWDAFLARLVQVSESERFVLLDLLSIAAAFDGRLSRMERHYLPQAFGEFSQVYMSRTRALTRMLTSGRLHAAQALCTLDYRPG